MSDPSGRCARPSPQPLTPPLARSPPEQLKGDVRSLTEGLRYGDPEHRQRFEQAGLRERARIHRLEAEGFRQRRQVFLAAVNEPGRSPGGPPRARVWPAQPVSQRCSKEADASSSSLRDRQLLRAGPNRARVFLSPAVPAGRCMAKGRAGRAAGRGLLHHRGFRTKRKSQKGAPSMMVCVRVSLTSGLNPSIRAKSRLHERRAPSSGMPSARYSSA
jgi:hypothetical protein